MQNPIRNMTISHTPPLVIYRGFQSCMACHNLRNCKIVVLYVSIIVPHYECTALRLYCVTIVPHYDCSAFYFMLFPLYCIIIVSYYLLLLYQSSFVRYYLCTVNTFVRYSYCTVLLLVHCYLVCNCTLVPLYTWHLYLVTGYLAHLRWNLFPRTLIFIKTYYSAKFP